MPDTSPGVVPGVCLGGKAANAQFAGFPPAAHQDEALPRHWIHLSTEESPPVYAWHTAVNMAQDSRVDKEEVLK